MATSRPPTARRVFRRVLRLYLLFIYYGTIGPWVWAARAARRHGHAGGRAAVRAGAACALLGALAAGGAVAWNLFPPVVDGSGTAATVELRPDDLSHITLEAPGALVVRPGAPSVRVTADDNLLPHLEVRAEGDGLHLAQRNAEGYRLRPKTPITYVVTVPRLHALTVRGPGRAVVEGVPGARLSVVLHDGASADLREIECESLNLVLWDRNEARVSGSADRAEIVLLGDGTADARNFRVDDDLRVELSDGGRAGVWAPGALRAQVRGGGTVVYSGSPRTIDQRITGGGRIVADP